MHGLGSVGVPLLMRRNHVQCGSLPGGSTGVVVNIVDAAARVATRFPAGRKRVVAGPGENDDHFSFMMSRQYFHWFWPDCAE